MKLTHAIILAAGLGKRMRPLTLTRPKPLVHVCGKKLIDYNLDLLADAGISQVVVNTSYMADVLEDYLALRTDIQAQISREEPEPLETGGGIFKALPQLGNAPFLSMNSDAIFPALYPNPIPSLCAAWDDASMDFLMLLVPKNRARGLHGKADFIRLEDGRIRKAYAGEEADCIFTGMEIMHPRVFDGCLGGAFSLNVLWQRSLNAEGIYERVGSIVLEGDWLHVGDIAGIHEAESYFTAAAARQAHE